MTSVRRQSRREFLIDSAASCAGMLAAGPCSALALQPRRMGRTGPPQRIAVLGAGLAGLVSAYELNRLGHDVTVLEARMRPGGRVLTLRDPFADGLYAEAGALFIPDNHDLTLKYSREFGLPLSPIAPRAFAEMFYVRGKRVIPVQGQQEEWPFELRADERALGYHGMWQRYVGDLLETVAKAGDLTSADWPPESIKRFDSISFAELLKQQGASPGAIALLRLGYFDLLGDGADECSALAVLRDSALRLKEQKVYHIRGGNDQLPKGFAQRLQDSIHYGCAVTRIEQTTDSAAVTYMQGGRQSKLTADRVVCALPFSTLRRVEIVPALPATKQRAINELPYTSVARVFLQSRTKFWTAAGLPAMTNTDLPLMWVWEPTYSQPGPRGIMEAYNAGPAARKVTAMREPERLDSTLDLMEKVYPGMRNNFEGGVTKCWDEDEWSRGDYAWFKPGQIGSLLPHIARPEGRIHFAGEHASSRPAWMQGALESGVRAAREVNSAR